MLTADLHLALTFGMSVGIPCDFLTGGWEKMCTGLGQPLTGRNMRGRERECLESVRSGEERICEGK